MTKIMFDLQSTLIIFHCKIRHTRTAVVKLALDTGATMTIEGFKFQRAFLFYPVRKLTRIPKRY